MLQAPKWTTFPRYPVIAGAILLSIGVSIAFWTGLNVSPLFETAMIRRGEVWRLVTSIFPHLNILHLVFNIYWLWVFGTLVETVYGHIRTAALILLFALGSGSFEFAFSTGGAGLSGVGYGFFGMLWILSRREERFRNAIDSRTIQLFVVWFFICIATTLANIMPVGNYAHGAGAVLGMLTGSAISLPERRRRIATAMGSLLVFGLWCATLGRPSVNFSRNAGYEEGQWGYDALAAHRYQEAIHWFHDALKYHPAIAEDWYDLGFAYQGIGQVPEALAAYHKSADLGDAEAEYYLGALYESGNGGLPKDALRAREWYNKAAERGNADVQNNVAWALATSPDPAIRNPEAALKYALKAVNSKKDRPEAHQLDTLAEAYYANQQFADAVRTEQQAIALDPTNKSDYVDHLARYRSGLLMGRQPAGK